MTRISQYAAFPGVPQAGDLVLAVDVSDTSMAPTGTDKKMPGSAIAPSLQLVFADQLGADPTGAVDSSGVIRAKQTALGAAPYVMVLGAGTYLMSGAFANLGPQQYIRGQGQFVTSITWSGAGPLITVVDPGTFNGGHRAGKLSGFSINGPQGNGGVAGIKYAALQSIQIDDVGFFGLDGGAVIGFKSGASDWAEEAVMTRLNISECGATSGYVFGFSGTSFDYSLIDAVVVVEANIDIVALSGGAQLQGLNLSLRGNVHGGAANTGAVVSIDRGAAGGTSYLTNASVAVSLEAGNAGAGNVGHWLLWMGSTNSTSQFSAVGVLSIFNAGVATQGISNPNFLPVSFNGITQAPGGGPMNAGDALAIMGGTCLTPAASAFTVPYQLNAYWQFGDVISMLLVSGANGTVQFNGANSFVRRGTLFLKQPASGAAGTVLWPANVLWLGGTAPTLSATSGYTDQIDCVYIPASAKWYLHWIGTYSG